MPHHLTAASGPSAIAGGPTSSHPRTRFTASKEGTHMPTTRALCATEIRWTGDLWFSADPADRARAKDICHRCPLLAGCAETALADPTTRGVWGGIDTRGRANLRGQTIYGPDPDDCTDAADITGAVPVLSRKAQPCGGKGAFLAHRRYDETCEQCETAHAARIETQRRARLDEEHAAGGTDNGHRIHRLLRETPCEACHNAALRVRAETKARAREHGAREWSARGTAAADSQEPAGVAA